MIRLLKKEDIPACLKIITTTKACANPKEAERLMELSLSPGIHFLNPNYYVFEKPARNASHSDAGGDGKVIGISGLYYDYEDPKNVMWLDYLAVSKEFQGQGFGSLLVENLEKIVKEKNVKMLCLFTSSHLALEFYKKKGFKIFGEIKNYYGKDKDRIWLYKKIA